MKEMYIFRITNFYINHNNTPSHSQLSYD